MRLRAHQTGMSVLLRGERQAEADGPVEGLPWRRESLVTEREAFWRGAGDACMGEVCVRVTASVCVCVCGNFSTSRVRTVYGLQWNVHPCKCQ